MTSNMTRVYIDPAFKPPVARVLTQLIAQQRHTLASHAAEADCVLRPESLTLPVRLAELAAMLRQPPRASYALAHEWQLLLSGRMLQHPGQQPVHVTERECLLLRYLLEHAGTVVSQDALMRDVWHYGAEAQSHTLETHIYRLRQKLEAISPSPCRIDTTDGGYLLLVNP